jgi:hypothetical protein
LLLRRPPTAAPRTEGAIRTRWKRLETREVSSGPSAGWTDRTARGALDLDCTPSASGYPRLRQSPPRSKSARTLWGPSEPRTRPALHVISDRAEFSERSAPSDRTLMTVLSSTHMTSILGSADSRSKKRPAEQNAQPAVSHLAVSYAASSVPHRTAISLQADLSSLSIRLWFSGACTTSPLNTSTTMQSFGLTFT